MKRKQFYLQSSVDHGMSIPDDLYETLFLLRDTDDDGINSYGDIYETYKGFVNKTLLMTNEHSGDLYETHTSLIQSAETVTT